MVDAEQVRKQASGNGLALPRGVPVSRTSPQLHLRVEREDEKERRGKEEKPQACQHCDGDENLMHFIYQIPQNIKKHNKLLLT